MWTKFKAFFTLLTGPLKALIFVSLLGVLVAASLTVYSRYRLNQADAKEQEANRYRVEGDAAWKESFRLKEYADGIARDLVKANAKLDKLQTVVDKIIVPPKPGAAPVEKKILIADLQAMGLILVVKPSTTIAPSLVGITEGDGKTIWGWGKENLRVPFLEQKIDAQTNLIVGLDKAKTLAEKLANARAEQAGSLQATAEIRLKEADSLRVVVTDVRKALVAERKKKVLYGIGALAGGYFLHKELAR